MNLSDYMGGRGLWKFNSMGGGVEKKVPSSPPQVFFSGIALRRYGCLNSDISKYGHLKEKCLYFHLQILSSKCDDIQSQT